MLLMKSMCVGSPCRLVTTLLRFAPVLTCAAQVNAKNGTTISWASHGGVQDAPGPQSDVFEL